MVANGFTKALTVVRDKNYVGVIGIKDQRKHFASIKRGDELRDSIQQRKTDYSKAFGFRTNVSEYVYRYSAKI